MLTALDFTSSCLEFCSKEPALLYDLNLMSLTLDFLVSACFAEIVHPSSTESDSLTGVGTPEGKNKPNERDAGSVFGGSCSVPKQEYAELREECLQAALDLERERRRTGGDDTASGNNSELTPKQPSRPDEEETEEGETVKVADPQGKEDVRKENRLTVTGQADVSTCKGVTEVSEIEEKSPKEFAAAADHLAGKTSSEAAEVVEKKTLKESAAVAGQLDEETYREVVKVADRLMRERIVEKLDPQLHGSIVKLVDLMTAVLALVQKRNSTKLFDRSSGKNAAVAHVLHILGHILASVTVCSVISVSCAGDTQLKDFLSAMIAVSEEDDDEEPDLHGNDGSFTQRSSKRVSPVFEHEDSVNLVTVALRELVQTAQVRTACTKCLTSFFASPTAKGGSPQKLSVEKSMKFGRVLKLNLSLCKVRNPLKTIKVIEELSQLLAGWFHREKDDTVAELQDCVSAVLKELLRREKLAEERRRNPTVAEVMEKVQKKLPRWKCEY